MAVKINHIVKLLQLTSPADLASLQQRHPDQKVLLGPLQFGPSEPTDPDALYGDLVKLGIPAAKTECRRLVTALHRTVVRSKRLRLGGAILQSLMSAGSLLSLAIGEGKAAIATTVVTLSVSLIDTAATYIDGTLLGTSTPAQLIEECLSCDAAVDGLTLDLARAGGNPDRQLELVKRLQDVAAKMMRISLSAGLGLKPA